METKYKVVYMGELQAGFEYESVISNLISISKMNREKAANFLSANKPTLVKKDLDREKAEKYCALLKKAGLKVQLFSSKNPPSESDPTSPKQEEANNQEPKKPETATKTTEQEPPKAAEQIMVPDNPYASPKADLTVSKTPTGDWLEKPQKVSASHGWHWIKRATTMFLAQPWKWMGMALVAGILLLLLQLIPIIGFIPNAILSMLFGGGLMLAAQSQEDGETIQFSYLFKGFSHNRNQLIVAGLLYLAGFLAIGIIMAIFIGGGIWAMLGVGSNDPETAVNAMAQNIPMFIVAILAGMALSIPLIMAVWFTTALVAINDQKALTAYKLSFQACLKNWLAFLVYGLAFLVIGLVIMAATAAASGLLAFFISTEGSFFLAFLPFLIMILIGFPLTIIGGISVFTSFKDVFYKSA